MPSASPASTALTASSYELHVAGSFDFALRRGLLAICGGLVHLPPPLLPARHSHDQTTQRFCSVSGASAGGRLARSPLKVFGLAVLTFGPLIERRCYAATSLASA